MTRKKICDQNYIKYKKHKKDLTGWRKDLNDHCLSSLTQLLRKYQQDYRAMYLIYPQ